MQCANFIKLSGIVKTTQRTISFYEEHILLNVQDVDYAEFI